MSTAVRLIQQDHLDPKEDLSPYTGQWVALRDGEVIAAALDAVSLRQLPDVRDTDALMPIPTASRGIFVA